MDLADHFRLCEHQHVVVATKIARMVVQAAHPRAAKVRLRQLVLLDHRAHRAIHHEDALAQEAGEFCGTVGLHDDFSVKRYPAKC